MIFFFLWPAVIYSPGRSTGNNILFKGGLSGAERPEWSYGMIGIPQRLPDQEIENGSGKVMKSENLAESHLN